MRTPHQIYLLARRVAASRGMDLPQMYNGWDHAQAGRARLMLMGAWQIALDHRLPIAVSQRVMASLRLLNIAESLVDCDQYIVCK